MNPLQDITNKVIRYDEVTDNQFEISLSPRRFPTPPTATSPIITSDDDTFSLFAESSNSVRRNTVSRRSEPSLYNDGRDRRVRFPSRPSFFFKSSSCELSYDDEDLDSTEDDEDVFHNNNNNNTECKCEFSMQKNIRKRNSKRSSLPVMADQSKVFKRLHPMSKNQLVDLVCDVSKISIAGSSKDKSDTALLQRLKSLLKNINKAMPERVYGLRRDAVRFRRVEVHLLLFKQECLKQCRSMYQLSEWYELFEYTTSACKLIHSLPVWENTSHNVHREQLFKVISSYCRKILQIAGFDKSSHQTIKNRLLECSSYHSSFKRLLKDADKLLLPRN